MESNEIKTERIDYFLCSNSSKGYVNFYNDNLGDLKSLVKLVNSPSDTLISELLEIATEEGYDSEVIHNCLDNTLEGIVIPALSAGVINVTTNTLDREEAYLLFAEAKKIHDEWEQVYIKNTDYAVIDKTAEKYCADFLDNPVSEKTGKIKNRFFGAATENGAVDYIENITQNIEKRYFIKGRPGTGKSGFLKKIAKAATESGYDTEVYHCAFDPESVDMVVVGGRGVCFFDSTAPHEYFPSRETDEIIDFYESAVKSDTDLAYKEQLDILSKTYKEKMQKATAHLKLCAEQKRKDDLQKLQSDIYDFSSVISEFKKIFKK